ncbi:MAG TPA: hypothetical protein DCX53_14690 [Anaerolineae bacterium]|nr:hypothetical protein [Anaerolineae bacterium]
MPIVEIEITLREHETLQENLASSLADELGEIFGSPPGTTWVKLQGLPISQYAENGSTPEGTYPVFVKVIKSEQPDPLELQKEAVAITNAVATVCRRPVENVHIIFDPGGRNRVSFGGKLVT